MNKTFRSLLPLLVLVCAMIIFVIAANQVGNAQSTQETELLNRALTRSITQCYALEGAYPASLTYLEEHYGLTYNSDKYFIDYQYAGDNLKPTVTIIERR